MKHTKRFFLLFSTLLSCLLILTACGKKNDSSSKTSNTPSAKTLIGSQSKFKDNIQNGHFEQSLSSKSMKVTSTLSGNYNYNKVTYANYNITNKSKKQNEKIWLTEKKLYLLLPGNHGKWIVTDPDNNNFDNTQITRRFDPDNFKELNDLMKSQAKVKDSNSSYSVTYNGTNSEIWQAMNLLVVDTMNSPGSQNMNIARTINAAQVNALKIQYIYNKSNKKLVSMNFKAQFSIGNNSAYNWSLTYDSFGEHNKLKVPTKISQNAVTVNN